MNGSTWNPQPGDRILIRNAGEYGWNAAKVWPPEVQYLGYHYDLASDGLALVCDSQNLDAPKNVTVLRSDLSPVEPPTAIDWREVAGLAHYENLGDLRRTTEARTCPTCGEPVTGSWPDGYYIQCDNEKGAPFERHAGPETEETRRLTKEDYADIENTRKDVLLKEMTQGLIEELIEAVDPKLAESYRARTRKEKDLRNRRIVSGSRWDRPLECTTDKEG